MRRPRRLFLPTMTLLIAPLLLTGCILAPPVDPEAVDCEQLDAVLAAHDTADAAVPSPPDDQSATDETIAHYEGLAELGAATGAAAGDALAIVQDPERIADLDAVVDASDALVSAAEQGVEGVESGDGPDQAGLPGLARLDLTAAMGSIQLDVCHYG